MIRSQRCWFLLLAALLLVGTSLTAQAAQPQEREVTLELSSARLEDALGLLFQGTGLSYTLDPGLGDLQVTLRITEVPFQQALRAILDLHDLTYRKDNEMYYITRRPQGAPEQGRPEPVAEAPAAEGEYFWIGPGGRYELQALDSRLVASWFGGTAIFMSPIPVAVAVPSVGGAGIGGLGGGIGGMGMGANITGGGMSGLSGLGGLGTFGGLGTTAGTGTGGPGNSTGRGPGGNAGPGGPSGNAGPTGGRGGPQGQVGL